MNRISDKYERFMKDRINVHFFLCLTHTINKMYITIYNYTVVPIAHRNAIYVTITAQE